MMHFRTLLFLLGLLLPISECQHLTTSRFTNDKKNLCNIPERIVRGCSRREPKARGLIQCTSVCSLNKTCIGISIDEDEMCLLHSECSEIVCSNAVGQHRYLSRGCEYGTFDSNTQSCKCVNGFRGDKCDKGFESCADLSAAGFGAGIHRVFLDPEQDGLELFRVNCLYYNNVQYRIAVFRNGGKQDFNKTWNEYLYGFYYDKHHFWMGLENIRKVINAGCSKKLEFAYHFRTNITGLVYRERYGFHITKDDYKFTFTGGTSNNWGTVPSGNWFGNCLGPLKNAPFSTWDRDQDGVADNNCASRAGSGWWYSGSCDNPCNALGYGFEYFGSKPSHQLFSAVGVNMASEVVNSSDNSMFEMTKVCD